MAMCGILFHAGYSISILGGFYIYLMINYAIMGNFKESSINGGTSISMSTWLMLCSLPIMLLLASGCYSASLALAIEKEQDERKKAENSVPKVYNPTEKLCVSCEENEKDSVFIPCGHMSLCS